MHGWYSSQCYKETGHWIKYKTPSDEIVSVTHTTEEKDMSTSKWNDIVYVGEITTLVSRHQKPPQGYYRFLSKKVKDLNLNDNK